MKMWLLERTVIVVGAERVWGKLALQHGKADKTLNLRPGVYRRRNQPWAMVCL